MINDEVNAKMDIDAEKGPKLVAEGPMEHMVNEEFNKDKSKDFKNTEVPDKKIESSHIPGITPTIVTEDKNKFSNNDKSKNSNEFKDKSKKMDKPTA